MLETLIIIELDPVFGISADYICEKISLNFKYGLKLPYL